MQRHRSQKYYFSSSATVYGNPQYLPLDEEHPLAATNPYGKCKLFTEYLLKNLQYAYSDMNAALLRYFNPVGAHRSYLLGENPKGVPNNLMPLIVKRLLGCNNDLTSLGVITECWMEQVYEIIFM
ncbi:MAG: NAD-dependent epimerase/dehydratase family protein [Halodesulfovibrio sp.]|uniref:NAD-dependent epimerase/dehydratase family protein n=1 Tax=Halodesulfovibrio sp. TaxID=1912772 RepID=UPI00359F055E